MKKYRIKSIGCKKIPRYRVDKRHWFLFIIPYWDIGASDMMPNYEFNTYEDALAAIREKMDKYIEF